MYYRYAHVLGLGVNGTKFLLIAGADGWGLYEDISSGGLNALAKLKGVSL